MLVKKINKVDLKNLTLVLDLLENVLQDNDNIGFDGLIESAIEKGWNIIKSFQEQNADYLLNIDKSNNIITEINKYFSAKDKDGDDFNTRIKLISFVINYINETNFSAKKDNDEYENSFDFLLELYYLIKKLNKELDEDINSEKIFNEIILRLYGIYLGDTDESEYHALDKLEAYNEYMEHLMDYE